MLNVKYDIEKNFERKTFSVRLSKETISKIRDLSKITNKKIQYLLEEIIDTAHFQLMEQYNDKNNS